MTNDRKYATGLQKTLGRYGITTRGKKILDVGGGSGEFGPIHLQQNGSQVYIVDPESNPNVQGVAGVFPCKVEDLFSSQEGRAHQGTFDLVIISALVKFVGGIILVPLKKEEWNEVLDAALSALKTGGEIFISHTDKDHGRAHAFATSPVQGEYTPAKAIVEMLQQKAPSKRVYYTNVIEDIKRQEVKLHGVKEVEHSNAFETMAAHFIVASPREITIQDGRLEAAQKAEKDKNEERRLKAIREAARQREKDAKKKNRKK